MKESIRRLANRLRDSWNRSRSPRILRLLFWRTIYEIHLMPYCRQPSSFKISEASDRATVNKIATNIIDSGTQMGKLIENFLDFTRTRLGQSLPVNQEEIDLALVCRQTVAELAAAYPERTIELSCPESVRGKV